MTVNIVLNSMTTYRVLVLSVDDDGSQSPGDQSLSHIHVSGHHSGASLLGKAFIGCKGRKIKKFRRKLYTSPDT